MSKKPKVSKEEYDAQTQRLYAKVGKIAVLSEHLNFAMLECGIQVLQVRGLPQNYAQTVLAGQTLEPMRRTWESLIKMYYAGDAAAIDMIDHLSNRVDKNHPPKKRYYSPSLAHRVGQYGDGKLQHRG
jgi:hypothetical protein